MFTSLGENTSINTKMAVDILGKACRMMSSDTGDQEELLR